MTAYPHLGPTSFDLRVVMELTGPRFVHLSSVPDSALRDALERWLEWRNSDSESVVLYGGVEVVADGVVAFGPQCCGELADIATWCRLADDDFAEGWVAIEGHPSPFVQRRGDLLEFSCVEEEECFSEGTLPHFAIPYASLVGALPRLLDDLARLIERLECVASDLGIQRSGEDLFGVSLAQLRTRLPRGPDIVGP